MIRTTSSAADAKHDPAAPAALQTPGSPVPPPHDDGPPGATIAPLRKAAIVLVSLDQSLASQLLAQLDRSSVEAVTWEIARLERIDPQEQSAVLDEFLGLGLRRLCFVFDDLLRLGNPDIRGAYHQEDITTWCWLLPARPRWCGPRCCARSTPPTPRPWSVAWRALVRSGSPTPRPPRPRSPSDFAAFTTGA